MPAGSARGVPPERDRVEVVRHEEELEVARRTVVRERVRLRTRVVTETRIVEVQVRRQELVVEREPLAGADADALPRDDRTPLEIVLHAEEPVVETRVVPMERVRVAKVAVAEQQRVVDELRAERVEVDRGVEPTADDRR
jgi:uncharacterized protein (TIGR02271 family)